MGSDSGAGRRRCDAEDAADHAVNLDENALKLGHDVSADGVIYGTVERYQERVGMDYSAASPASVSFSLKFVDLKSKQVVWTAKFAKSQAALSQNLFDLANFVQRSGTMGARA